MTAKQEAGLTALLTSKTATEAAEKAGVTTRTLVRWLQEPEFSEAYNTARRQLTEAALTELQSASSEAVTALKRNLLAKSEAVQVSAAKAILDYSITAVNTMDLEQRIEELEQALTAVTTTTRRLHGVR